MIDILHFILLAIMYHLYTTQYWCIILINYILYVTRDIELTATHFDLLSIYYTVQFVIIIVYKLLLYTTHNKICIYCTCTCTCTHNIKNSNTNTL